MSNPKIPSATMHIKDIIRTSPKLLTGFETTTFVTGVPSAFVIGDETRVPFTLIVVGTGAGVGVGVGIGVGVGVGFVPAGGTTGGGTGAASIVKLFSITELAGF